MPSVLLALPRDVCILELNTACAGPVLEALKRFRQLQEFRIGNGADIDWGCPGAAGLMSKLVQLRLDCRQRPEWDGERNVVGGCDIHTLPSGIANALAAGASRLRGLALSIQWSPSVPVLCTALPALVDLK